MTCVSAADRNEEMKKSILAVCLGLAGFWSVLAEDSPIAAPGRVNEQGDAELPSGELLSDHVAEAEFTGIIHRKCRFLTSLCPDKCDHARDFAVFRIVKYLDYRKPGKYGDEKQDQLMVDVTDADYEIKQGDEVVLVGSQGSESIPVEEVAAINNSFNFTIRAKSESIITVSFQTVCRTIIT